MCVYLSAHWCGCTCTCTGVTDTPWRFLSSNPQSPELLRERSHQWRTLGVCGGDSVLTRSVGQGNANRSPASTCKHWERILPCMWERGFRDSQDSPGDEGWVLLNIQTCDKARVTETCSGGYRPLAQRTGPDVRRPVWTPVQEAPRSRAACEGRSLDKRVLGPLDIHTKELKTTPSSQVNPRGGAALNVKMKSWHKIT